MNHPVPVSLKACGDTVCGPLPQLRDTSAATSEMTSTVAGVARRLVSCTERPGWACALMTTIFATRSPKARETRVSAIRRIIGALAGILHHTRGADEPS